LSVPARQEGRTEWCSVIANLPCADGATGTDNVGQFEKLRVKIAINVSVPWQHKLFLTMQSSPSNEKVLALWLIAFKDQDF
jgi:hypothetical protein